ncbi:MAG: nucleoid-associated protein [Saprospirales bacterium]|nr:nucleoid-associated protein [Saprospirales bacterium]
MLDFSSANLRRLSIAWVGNKNRYEGVNIPKQTLVPVHDVAHELLIGSFLKTFEKSAEFFYFFHEEDISNHLVFQSCLNIFQDPEMLAEEAGRLAGLLYEHCENPRVQGGEFLVMYFDDLLMAGEPASAIGIWKIQTKDPYLKVERTAENFALNVLEGIPTGKLETAALIFNLDESEGYRICATDTVSKKEERSFWKDEFLRLRPIEDNYFNTRHYISLSGEFIHERLPHKFGLDRADQLDALYRSGLYFKENEQFEVDDFAETLFPDAEQRTAFKEYRDEYARMYAVTLEDKFDISLSAVKKEFKVLKSVIKLDKNFHIYVHGRRDLIERGFDEDKGKKYYKVFFDDEE